jgi:hypothetical protein
MSFPANRHHLAASAFALTFAIAFGAVANLLFSAVPASAAILTAVGAAPGIPGQDNDEVDRWRSTSVAKTFDVDADNVYGTAGYVLFAADDIGNSSTGIVEFSNDPFTYVSGTRRTVRSVPSYLSFAMTNFGSTTGTASSYGYQAVDNPSVAPGPSVSNMESGAFLRTTAFNTEASLFDMTIGAGAPSVIRLGLLYGNTDAYNGTFRIEQIAGGIGSVIANQTNGVIQLSFFDIIDAAPGDTFRVYGTKTEPVGNQNVLLGGLTFDVIPEPASSTALLLGLGMLAARRRR